MNDNKFKVYLYVNGIKKRCRKTERHQFKLGYKPLDVDLQDLELVAKSFVETNMKTYDKKITLDLSYVEVKDNWETMQLFDARSVKHVFEV